MSVKYYIPLLLSSLLSGMLSAQTYADEPPVVQVQVEPAVVNVGQAVTLRISVFAPTWFPQPPSFPSFELPNTITRLPANSSGPVSQRVGNATWSGIQRRYQVFPLIAGQFRIQDRSLAVTYVDPKSNKPVEMELPIPDLIFDAEVPAGAESLDPYLAGQSLELRRVLETETADLAAGDALVIRYRATLEGLPSLFLPPLARVPDQPGLSVYADEPTFSDDNGRAVREEKVTLVFDNGGEFTLPEFELRWWNLRTAGVEVVRLDALTLDVTGPAAMAPVVADAATSDYSRWLFSGVLLVLLIVALRRPVARWRESRRMAELEYLKSEPHAFDQLIRALRSGDGQTSYNNLLAWLTRLDSSPDLQSFCAELADEPLQQQVTLLRDSLFSQQGGRPDHARLAQLLSAARADRLERISAREVPALPSLNP